MFTNSSYKSVEKVSGSHRGTEVKGTRKMILELSLPGYRDGIQGFKYYGPTSQVCPPTQSPEEDAVNSSSAFDFVVLWGGCRTRPAPLSSKMHQEHLVAEPEQL